MATTGKTGADSIFQSFKHICHVLTKYNAKFVAVVAAAQAAGAISAEDAALITAFLTAATATCDALGRLAGYSGF
jgi:hypothetical protein